MLILFKVLQHHSNLFCGPEQELNLHSPDSIANTTRHVLILYPTFGSSRVCYSSLLDNLYYTPLQIFRGATLPFVHQAIWSGRQDSNLRPLVRSVYKIRTYDTSFIIQTHQFLSLLVNCNQNQCSSQLNYFPKCVVFYNTFFYL